MARFEKSKRDAYIDDLFGTETTLLQNIRESSDESLLHMQISPYEGKILALLLKMINAKKVIEIGLLSGYSATWIADSLPEDGNLFSFEYDIRGIERAQKNLAGSPQLQKMTFIHGDAEQTLSNFHEEVDAIFIDANKAAYPAYFQHAKRLLKPGGLIIADNVFLFGNIYGEAIKEASQKSIDAMSEFNAMVAADPQFQSVIIPTSEGMLVALKI